MAKKLVGLLPLKAHSSRIESKNFRSLGGKPLVFWMLETLLSVREIAKVVINTDARRRLADMGIVASDRLCIRDRPTNLCGDFVSMNSIIADDIGAVAADCYLMTHTTNPLISASTVRDAIRRYKGRACGENSLFSVNMVQKRFYRRDRTPVNHDPDNLIRTQDLEPWFEENSCIYVFTRDSFNETLSRIGSRPILFETPRLESIDIDEPDDWEMVEALLEKRQRNQEKRD